MPSNESWGCFVSPTAVRSTAGKDELRRLCFGTTAGSDFRGRPLAPDGQMESMSGVLNMGHKSNKYMSFPMKQVPNFSREFCNYSFDFRKKPFSDNALNAYTCDQLREYGTAGNIVTANLPKSKTRYATDFGERDKERMHRAKQKSAEPPHRYCDPGKLLITKSFSQSMHSAPSAEINAKGQAVLPVPLLANAKDHWQDAMRTTYGGDFMQRPGLEGRKRRMPSYSSSEPTLTSFTQSR